MDIKYTIAGLLELILASKQLHVDLKERYQYNSHIGKLQFPDEIILDYKVKELRNEQ